MTVESLEPRMLLAVGPQLVSINPNDGEAFDLNGSPVVNVAPRELRLRFSEQFDDNGQVIGLDPATLDGIRVTRTDNDGTFSKASWISDLNSNGRIYVEFTAKVGGLAGNGIQINLSRSNPREPGLPRISVDGRTVTAVLNLTPNDKSTALDLVTAINQDPVANQLIEARLLGIDAETEFLGRTDLLPGEDITTNLGTGLELTLDHAAKAKSLIRFADSTTGEVSSIQLSAVDGNSAGNGVIVDFVASDSRSIQVNGRKLTIQYNPSDLQFSVEGLVTAINDNLDASRLVRADFLGGSRSQLIDADVDITTATGETASQFTLLGARDAIITPGFVGVDPDRPNEVIMRFAETLPDDIYQIDVFGFDGELIEGQTVERAIALRNTAGDPFDNNPDTPFPDDFHLQFELNLGAQVTAIVPQPIEGVGSSSVQLENVVHVYFNDDNLHSEKISTGDLPDTEAPSVVDPSLYRLVNVDTGMEIAAESVEYDPAVDRAVVTFAESLNAMPGSHHLRIGSNDEDQATIVDVDAESGIVIGTPLDGDADGHAGGAFDFWFRTGNTIFVDKTTAECEPVEVDGEVVDHCGSLTNPHSSLATALSAAATNGDIVRVLGKSIEFDADGFVDRTSTEAYLVGVGTNGQTLEDGLTLRIPKDVTLMVDSGAVFKMRASVIEVGSSATLVDRSNAALQILGTPNVIGSDGQLLRDRAGDSVAGSVFFTSYNDESLGIDTNPFVEQVPSAGNWGGIIFQESLDRDNNRPIYDNDGIFMNYVNHADMRYGGGLVNLNSVSRVVAPIHIIDSRPTVTFNTITRSADASMSATPDSFAETPMVRIGPEIHGNRLVENTVNGLHVDAATPSGGELEKLTVDARWNDTDIVHVIPENLEVLGSLTVDPAIIAKLEGTRIDAEGSTLIAEGLDGNEIVFTSLSDNRYGAGGTFATSNVSAAGPVAGDWSGIYARGATVSLEHVVFAYGGGISRVEGTLAAFNILELRGGTARVADSRFEYNSSGLGGQGSDGRAGRGTTGAGVIYVEGAQPVIVGNYFLDNEGAVINIAAQSLDSVYISDPGRMTGDDDVKEASKRDDDGNRGPLIRGNSFDGNLMNGMRVRGGALPHTGDPAGPPTGYVWDDTDIVHVLFEEITLDNFSTLRLESSPTESLVVKLGLEGGFTTSGTPIADPLVASNRVGGSLHVIGQPGHPVELTSYDDDTVGAGRDGRQAPQYDTNGANRPLRTSDEFDIIINYGPNILAKPQAVLAVETAVQLWEQIIEDPITLTFDFELDSLGGPLGGSFPTPVLLDYDQVRQAMIDDAAGRDHELPLLSQVPTYNDLEVVLPVDRLNPYSVSDVLELQVPNARALGFNVSGPTSDFDPSVNRDGNIRFEVGAYWDYDKSDGIHPDAYDFFGVVLHELGHSLGFTSSVDEVGAGVRNVTMTPLDLFRLKPGEGGKDFANAERVLDPQEVYHVFYDGGNYDPSGIAIPGLQVGDIPLSSVEDGNQASHWKDDAIIGVNIGIMDPTAPVIAMSNADKSAFDLIGYDIVGGGTPRDWQGIKIETFSNDRNVEMFNELEPTSVLDSANSNSNPEFAEFLGTLATGEKSSDEVRRLGFQVNGYINSSSDADVYSFSAKPGTEVWFDIDNTTETLDTVLELVDINGDVLAIANDAGELPLAFGDVQVFSVDKSSVVEHDIEGAIPLNPKDSEMRLLLPGQSSENDEIFHVRIRSNDAASQGAYELQVRLREADEIPGTTVRLSNIAYATSGIRVRGAPGSSPLTGETTEDGSLDGFCTIDADTDSCTYPADVTDFVEPQNVGVLAEADRHVISFAGALDDDNVDFFEFTTDEPSSIDLDYGFSDQDIQFGDDLAITVYQKVLVDDFWEFNLVAFSSSSGDPDDLNANPAQLDAGTFSGKDPMVFLPEAGTYVLAVHYESDPPDFAQFTEFLPKDPNVRVAPNVLLPTPSFVPVPFHLGDAILYVSQAADTTAGNEVRSSKLYTIDPFTGSRETTVGSFGPQVGDVAIRQDGRLFSLSVAQGPKLEPTDENSGNWLEISLNGFYDDLSVLPEQRRSLLISDGNDDVYDDGILTFENDPDFEPPDTDPEALPPIIPSPSNGDSDGVGIQYQAMTFGAFGEYTDKQVMFAVGSRGVGVNADPDGPGFTKNILYMLDGGGPEFDGSNEDPATAIPVADRRDTADPMMMEDTAYTDVIERGHVGFTERPGGPEGQITGIAFSRPNGGSLYAVNEYGELLRINGPTSMSASATRIATIMYDESPVPFTSLALGPQDIEGGAYADLFFALDTRGNLYAFDTEGTLQPIFVDGQTRVSTGIRSSNGIAFGTLQKNLWTGGSEPTFTSAGLPDDSQPPTPDTLDYPGGVYGSVVSQEIDLGDYRPADSPHLYFEYVLATQNETNPVPTPEAVVEAALMDKNQEIEDLAAPTLSDTNPIFPNPEVDSLRVYAAAPDGNWVLLASNIGDEVVLADGAISELYDNSWQDERRGTIDTNGDVEPPLSDIRDLADPVSDGVIARQARIDLSDFAGIDGVRLRFEYSSAGTMNLGNINTVGSQLRMIPGNNLSDGETFEIDAEVFEFDRGTTITAVGAASIVDGDTIAVTSALGTTVTFEFDSDGTISVGDIGIAFTSTDSQQVVADALYTAISGSGFDVYQNGADINLPVVTVTAPAAFPTEGAAGLVDPTSSNHLVAIHSEMSAEEVEENVATALANVFAGGNVGAIKRDIATIHIIGHRITDAGPLGEAGRRNNEQGGFFTDPIRSQFNGNIYAELVSDNDDAVVTIPSGVAISQVVLGLTRYGEAIADGETKPPSFDDSVPTDGFISPPNYQVEIRSAVGGPLEVLPVNAEDLPNRLTPQWTMIVPPGAQLVDGATITLSDGVQSFVLEFDDTTSMTGVSDPSHVAIEYTPADTAVRVGNLVRRAINGLPGTHAGAVFGVKASTDGSGKVYLTGIPQTLDGELIDNGVIVIEKNENLVGLLGTSNLDRAQGQLIIQQNQILHSGEYGIINEDGFRDLPSYGFYDRQEFGQFSTGDYSPHAGSVKNLSVVNSERLAPGITISNNVVANSGRGGIHFSGDANGIVLIAPSLGPRDSGCEAWDGDTFVISGISDSAIDDASVYFEFDVDGVLLNVNTVPVVLPVSANTGVPGCAETPSASRGLVADAIEEAIRASNLDVQTYRGAIDEIFIEGATQVVTVRAVDGTSPYWNAGAHASDVAPGPVPFGRIVNNTIVGHGGEFLRDAELEDVGILVDENASVTMLNNIVANFTTGLQVDSSSQSSIVASMNYHGNLRNAFNVGIGDLSVEMDSDEPLFVDIENGNYYPARQSRIIDSAVDSLEDRPNFADGVKLPHGIGLSPILAPSLDVTGLLRLDDPDVESSLGVGSNVFKDRGAVDRADFDGPKAVLLDPQDNDDGSDDVDTRPTRVQTLKPISSFDIQLDDRLEFATSIQGTGADPATVIGKRFVIRQDGNLLEEGVDYRFGYDATNLTASLSAISGIWPENHTYVITVNEGLNADGFDAEGVSGIRDRAGNLLKANQLNGTTQFSILLGGIVDTDLGDECEGKESLCDFGDAAPPYPVASHDVSGDLLLGRLVSAEENVLSSANMDADHFDDGIDFVEVLRAGRASTIQVTVSGSLDGGADRSAYVHGWIDFNNDGAWADDERILADQVTISATCDIGISLDQRVCTQTFDVDVPIDAFVGPTGARFRIGESADLTPMGYGGIGEVEDYLVTIRHNYDYSDANAVEAWHQIRPNWFLGARIDVEDIAPRSTFATGDGSDDDGIEFLGSVNDQGLPEVEIGRNAVIEVTANFADGQTGYLHGWIDMNADGVWDASEKIVSEAVARGTTNVSATIPSDGIEGATFARFRLSDSANLDVAGGADAGEVEDYQLLLVPPSNSWHFALDPTDVQGLSNGTSPLDALLVINELSTPEHSDDLTGRLDEVAAPPPYFDVNNDGYVSPIDALLVINQLDINAAVNRAVATPAALPLVADLANEAPLFESDASTRESVPDPNRFVQDLALRSFHGQQSHRRTLAVINSLARRDATPDDSAIDSLFADLDNLRDGRDRT